MPKTIPLRRSVKHEGTTYTEVTVDDLTLGDMEDLESAQKGGQSELESLRQLVMSLTGAPAAVIREVRAKDLKDLVADPLGSGGTGAPSPQSAPTS